MPRAAHYRLKVLEGHGFARNRKFQFGRHMTKYILYDTICHSSNKMILLGTIKIAKLTTLVSPWNPLKELVPPVVPRTIPVAPRWWVEGRIVEAVLWRSGMLRANGALGLKWGLDAMPSDMQRDSKTGMFLRGFRRRTFAFKRRWWQIRSSFSHSVTLMLILLGELK